LVWKASIEYCTVDMSLRRGECTLINKYYPSL
jgi:hypothetical protein